MNNELIKPNQLQLIFPKEIYNKVNLREISMQIIKKLTNMSDKWIFRFQSAIDELCSNAIEYGCSNNGKISLAFSAVPDNFIEVSVEDNGQGTKQINAEQMKEILEKEQQEEMGNFSSIRGNGLTKIVKIIVDQINFYDLPQGGLKVIIKKSLQKETEKIQFL